MNLKFKSEGGFRGLARQVEISSENLPYELGQMVNRLLENRQAFQPTEPENPYLRDAHRYSLELETDNEKTVFRFSETDVPDKLRPLIDFLQQKSQESDNPYP